MGSTDSILAGKNCFHLIHKPPGIPSRKYVLSLLNISGKDKFGIEGILDPFADGLLIAATGYCTRFLPLFHSLPKEYAGTIILGISTDTLDKDGNITATSPVPPLEDSQIQEAMKKFAGRIKQIPPIFSNTRIKGKTARSLARKHPASGEELAAKMPEKTVEIFSFELLKWHPPEIHFRVTVSAGTYIRSLARDLAFALGTHGHLSSLTRNKIGRMEASPEEFPECRSADEIIQWIPRLRLDDFQIRNLFYGKELELPNSQTKDGKDGIYLFTDREGRIAGYGNWEQGRITNRRLVPWEMFFSGPEANNP